MLILVAPALVVGGLIGFYFGEDLKPALQVKPLHFSPCDFIIYQSTEGSGDDCHYVDGAYMVNVSCELIDICAEGKKP